MNSQITRGFAKALEKLPARIQQRTHAALRTWAADPFHKGLHFKQAATAHNVWSLRIGRRHRALAFRTGNDISWYWVGDHDAYMKLLSRR